MTIIFGKEESIKPYYLIGAEVYTLATSFHLQIYNFFLRRQSQLAGLLALTWHKLTYVNFSS